MCSSIIYRDLKPDNIGFDVRGTVKLFDFGLSREFDPARANKQGQYLLTENTGSPRYMAPEVAFGQAYNELADVYSFSLLLWHIVKLESPFRKFSLPQLQQRVYKEGLRPKCDGIPKALSQLLAQGWGHPLNRPSMSKVVSVVQVQAGIFPDASNEQNETEARMTPSLLSALELGYPGAVAAAAAFEAANIPEEEPDTAADASVYHRADASSTLEEEHTRSLVENTAKQQNPPSKVPSKSQDPPPTEAPSLHRLEI